MSFKWKMDMTNALYPCNTKTIQKKGNMINAIKWVSSEALYLVRLRHKGYDYIPTKF